MIRVPGSFGTSDRRSCNLYILRTPKQYDQTAPSLSPLTSTVPSATFADHPCAILQIPRDYISIQSIHKGLGAKSKNALESSMRSNRRQVHSNTLAAGLFTAKGWGYADGFQSMSSSCTALVSLFTFTAMNHGQKHSDYSSRMIGYPEVSVL